ncbi:uncharacterized protein [Asterias amurensis]|uniref:uncharacterized protein n=1 Tax=Asterias amurensis TaxID=7602 RepID=UPI003AB691E1
MVTRVAWTRFSSKLLFAPLMHIGEVMGDCAYGYDDAQNKTAESSSSGPPAAKPVATVLPVPSLSVSTTTASQANQPATGQGHQVTVFHPVPGEGGTQQVFQGFPTQRFMVPGPGGTQQQVFGFRGTGPMIRIMHHQHPGLGLRATLPNTSTSVSTGTTGLSTSGFMVHHNLVAGPRTATPGSATTSTSSSCTVHHHHVVHGPRVVFSNAPPGLQSRHAAPGLRMLVPTTSTSVSTGTTSTTTSGFVVHHNLVAGPRTEIPGSATTSTMSSSTVHHHHVVHGPRVVFSNAPPGLSSGHAAPGLRMLVPTTSTLVSTGTTGTSTSGFVVHHNLVAGPRPETAVSASGSATTSTLSSSTVHHHHVVQGPQVVFSNVPPNLPPGNAVTAVAPTFVMHHQHPTIGQRPGMPATVSSTVAPSPSTSTVNAGAAFQIQFQCRPGQPPTPMIRVFQNGPPGPPGTHRGMQGQQGAPVFRSPVPSTTAPQTSSAPTPSPVPQATPTQVRPSGYQRNASAAAPEIELNAKPELAALAQHIRNIAADVKPTKTGNTRGGAIDQERRDAALASLRKKAARAKSKAESRNTPVEETSVDNVESPSNENELPADSLKGPAEESTAKTGDSTRRRKKRRKKAKQQSPSSERAEQSDVSNAAVDKQTDQDQGAVQADQDQEGVQTDQDQGAVQADQDQEGVQTDQDQGGELASQKDGTEKIIKEDVKSLSEPKSATSFRSVEEDKSTDDSDDKDSSESDSELASYSKSDDASQSLSSQSLPSQSLSSQSLSSHSGSSGKSCQAMSKSLSISKDEQASWTDTTTLPKNLLESRQDANEDAGSLETELQTATGSSKANDASELSPSENSMTQSVSQNSQVGVEPKTINEVIEEAGSKSVQVSQPLDPQEDFKSKVTSRADDFVSHVKPNRATNHVEDVKVTDTVVPSCTKEIFFNTDTVSELEIPKPSLSNMQTDAESVAQPDGNTLNDSVSNNTQATDTKTEKSDSQTTPSFEMDGVQSSDLGLKPVRPKVKPSATTHIPDENLLVKQDQTEELQQDHLDVQREQLALERKRLDFESQRLLLEQGRLLIAEDHLKTEQEKLKAMQEQLQLQRDQLSLDRQRFALEQDRVEVSREGLQVERHRLCTAEQRAEDSKLILSSLQEISQTLQMSVGLSFQQYGFPVSYDSDGGAASEQQGYMQDASGEVLPAEEALFEEHPPEEDDSEWTVVGGTRASLGHHQSQWMPTEGAVTDQGAQSGWPTEIPSLDSDTLSAEYLQTLEEMTQPRASGDLRTTLQRTVRPGERSNEEQSSREGQRLSPIHGLSTIEGRRTTTQSSSYRQSRGGRSDGRRGWNGSKKNKKSKPGD